MFVLDTNVVVAALNGVDAVAQRLAAVSAAQVAIPAVVIGELVYGALRSRHVEANLARARALWRSFTILPFDETAAERYGAVRAALHAQGRPKSEFDMIIACTSILRGATLVTNDASLKDGAIPDLVVEDWLAS